MKRSCYFCFFNTVPHVPNIKNTEPIENVSKKHSYVPLDNRAIAVYVRRPTSLFERVFSQKKNLKQGNKLLNHKAV